MRSKTGILLASLMVLSASSMAVAETALPKAAIAKVCTNCHKAEPGVLRGYFENVSLKSKAIQLRMDDIVEVLKYDENTLQVVNDARKAGNIDLLKNNALKKGHEIRIEYSESNGVKTAKKLTAKPPVDLPASMLISTPEMEKLVAKGKGYYLFDSRPAIRFQEGAIPTAVNLPYPAFDKLAPTMLPADKNALIIFYCAGVTCNMSPASGEKAKKLGYTNIKVYKEGMPAWSEKNFGVLTAQILKEAWLDKDVPHILLDTRKAADAKKGFINGAVTFPAAKAKKLATSLGIKQKKAPIIVYDANGGSDSEKVAAHLIKAGYGNVKMLIGGYNAWKTLGYGSVTGAPAVKAAYIPKPKQGEVSVEEFVKALEGGASDSVIVDVRTAEDRAKGSFKPAKNIPLPELRDRASELPRDKKILLQCNTGNQAEMGYHTLKELGYTNVQFLNATVKFEADGKYVIAKD